MTRSILTAFALVAMAVPASAQTVVQEPGILTRGEAVVKRAPDRAWLTVATEIREAKPTDARTKSAQITTAVQNALKAAGLAPDAIRTIGYSLTPEMEWISGVSRIRGYVVRNQMEVRVDDLDKLPDVIDAANASKASGLSIIGPRFDLKSRAAAEHEALRLAVESALGRAQAIASGARRTLGAILRIEEQTTSNEIPFPRQMTMARAGRPAGEPETPIAPGEIEIRAQVMVTIAIR
jgi:uncharacterized protein YggE